MQHGLGKASTGKHVLSQQRYVDTGLSISPFEKNHTKFSFFRSFCFTILFNVRNTFFLTLMS